jgi:hypothetical protein
VWGIQLLAVVGGHVLGAWFGHRAAVIDAAKAPGTPGAPRRSAAERAAEAIRTTRLRQVPLAVLMVFLTALTLWSLGQNIVHSAGGGILG